MNLEIVFRGSWLYQIYSANASVVWVTIKSGEFFPGRYLKKSFSFIIFLSIFSYLTTSSSAAMTPSPLGLARAHAPRGTDRYLRR